MIDTNPIDSSIFAISTSKCVINYNVSNLIIQGLNCGSFPGPGDQHILFYFFDII
jgi:hypothetical protein